MEMFDWETRRHEDFRRTKETGFFSFYRFLALGVTVVFFCILVVGCGGTRVALKDISESGATGHWAIHNPAEIRGFGNGITSIVEDRKGNLWVGNKEKGVVRFNGESWISYGKSDGLAHKKVECMMEDHNGNVWVGTFGRVSRHNGHNWQTFGNEQGFTGNWVISLMEDGEGNVWCGTHGYGVHKFDGTTWTPYVFNTPIRVNSPSPMSYRESQDTQTLLSSGDATGVAVGLASLLVSSASTKDDSEFKNNNCIHAMLEDSHGDLWFSTGTSLGGLPKTIRKCEGLDWKTNREVKSLSHTDIEGKEFLKSFSASGLVYTIFEDSHGHFWFGTQGHGVYMYDGKHWEQHSVNEKMYENSVKGIEEDKAGNMWFATPAGIKKYDGKSWTSWAKEVPVSAVLKDSKGNLWFGADWPYQGLIQYSP